MPWHGASEGLIADSSNPWQTPAEAAGFESTPSYEQTRQWLEKLCAASPLLELVQFGKTANGRDLLLVIAGKDFQIGSPHSKPVLLAQAGIHSGEIDGKDAGMMLLRDLAFQPQKQALLDQATFLFIPILNADGHENTRAINRVNQRGPTPMGWRTTARNLNLNRDYTKADTPEMQALLTLIHRVQPDLYLDLHVTDGEDTQYDITYGFSGPHGYSPHLAQWMTDNLRPVIDAALVQNGHHPFNFFFSMDNQNPKAGIVDFMGSPRFSNAYGDAIHLPAILVENHSLKPYRQRVLGTYVLVEGCLKLLGQKGMGLRNAIQDDRAARPEQVVLTWAYPKSQPQMVDYLGVAYELHHSDALGLDYLKWTGKPETWKVPFIRQTEPALSIKLPKAYWVPAAWSDVIQRIHLHQIQYEVLKTEQNLNLEFQRIDQFECVKVPYEGRMTVTTQSHAEQQTRLFAPGSIRIPTDQPLADLVALLLEPGSPDSFLQWGFFNEIFQRTEYIEPYIMGPLAEKMLKDPQIKADYEKALAEKTIGDSPREKMEWFYSRSPYYDPDYLLYPVGWER
ncbi:MAG: M14 family metallopeptidase [Acidobacteria bacterium]|nr:M14 family metallopeptidase [Acidobacteriota bacterium]MCB9399153.1 M14 family metallopeptidase [Acidobacteriota bacterium]